jgi:hypothetical protein
MVKVRFLYSPQKCIYSVNGNIGDFQSSVSSSSLDRCSKCAHGVMVAYKPPKLTVKVRILMGVQNGSLWLMVNLPDCLSGDTSSILV